MNLGISVTNTEIHLSTRKGESFKEAAISGCNLASFSRMTPEKLDKVKDDFARCMYEIGFHKDDDSTIAVSHPSSLGFMEILDLKMLFKKLGLDVKRYIHNGMACAIHLATQDISGNVCCICRNESNVELSLVTIENGKESEWCVAEAICNRTYQDDGWNYEKMSRKLLDLTDDVQGKLSVYVHSEREKPLCFAASSLSGIQKVEETSEYSLSRGALVQAELLSRSRKGLLPLELYSLSIICVVNGEATVLLPENMTVPAKQICTIDTIPSDRIEIELIAVTNSTGKRESFFKTTFLSVLKHQTIEVDIDIDANKKTWISMNTGTFQVQLNY